MTDASAVPPAAAAAPLGERLERRVIAYWLVSDSVGTAVLGGLLFAARTALHDRLGAWRGTVDAALYAIVGLLLASALILPWFSWLRWRFAFRGDLLWMRYGVLFVEERAVPVRRMQHVDLLRGPIERLFGLATLVVYTAGNEGSAFRVPGLSKARAQALRDRIVGARGHDVL